MDSDVSTSFRLPAEMQTWLTDQARGRDSTRSMLVRSLIREAQAAVAATEGVGGPASWPKWVEPPARTQVPHVRRRHRGKFA